MKDVIREVILKNGREPGKGNNLAQKKKIKVRSNFLNHQYPPKSRPVEAS